jgi:Domain of Unknown Function (DUF748)
MSERNPPKAPMRKLLLVPVLAAVLVTLYALAGFLLVPWIAPRELPRLAEQDLHHRARVGEIRFNPFTLRLQARDFKVDTMDGRPVLGFAEAVVKLDWASLVRRAWLLSDVRLVDPTVEVEIAKDGRLNLAALAPDPGGTGSAQPPRFAIEHFSVSNGSIGFEDQRQGYRNRVEHLSVELASLSTVETAPGSFTLQGQTPQGAKLRWKGGIALNPLAATGTLALKDVALAELMPYVNDFTTARIVAGRADLALPYELGLVQGKLRFAVKGAKLELHELALRNAGKQVLLAKFAAISLAGINFDSVAQRVSLDAARAGVSTVLAGKEQRLLARIGPVALDGTEFGLGTHRGSVRALALGGSELKAGGKTKPLAAIGRLALDGIAFDLGTQRFSAKVLHVDDFKLALRRDAKGALDLPQAFAGNGDSGSGTRPGKWQASIGKVQIARASARYTDRTAKTPLALAAEGLSGSFGLNAASDGKGVRLRLDAGNLTLARLEAGAASAPSKAPRRAALRISNLALAGAGYDSGENTLGADAVRIASLGVDTVLENGRPSLLDLLPVTSASKSAKSVSAQTKLFELGRGRVSIADRASGIAVVLQHLKGKLDDVSSDPAKTLSFDVSADVKSGGHIALLGRAVPARGRLRAKIKASSVALAPLAPLLAQFASVRLGSGEFSLNGALQVGGKQAKVAYSGSAAVADLALDDPTGVRIFGWGTLATDALKASLAPNRVDIDELRLTAPAGRFAIAKDGTSNLSHAFARMQAKAGENLPAASGPDAAQQAAPGAKGASTGRGQAAAVAVAVRRVQVEQGALDFSDDSLSPNFVAKIVDLAGSANGLSSDRETRSQFTLEGRIGEFGYARLSGAVNPFAPRDRSAFRVQLRNIDLTTMSPYAMHFAGYRIATGSLALDLHYRVRANLIEGDNKITLEHFKLGERVESPDALKLPFELAVALLKDPDGTINLQVPVKGNLDDPQFSLAPLIWKAVGNLIGNIVAAPFRALGHLFGGGTAEDGGTILFDPGRSRLLPPEREKLARIAEELAKRPELKLLIPAHYDTEADQSAMKRAALARELDRRAGFAPAENDEPGLVNLEDRRTRSALRALFTERFSKAELKRLRSEAEAKARAAGAAPPSLGERLRSFASGEPQVADRREFYRTLLRRLREAQPLAPNALTELGQQRALAIEAALQAAGVSASRMERTTSKPSADAKTRQVSVQLSLAAH